MDRTIANRLHDESARVLAGQQLREKHYDVFAVYLASQIDGSQIIPQPALPRVRYIQPRPSVISKDVITVDEDKEQARLQRLEMTGISRTYTEAEMAPDFWLLLPVGTEVTPATALTLRPRYRNLGTPTVRQNDYTVVVTEER